MGILCLISMITLLTLVSCGGGDDDLGAPQTTAATNELVPITFNGSQGVEAAVTRAGGTPLHDAGVNQFHVWGYKNMTSETQTVFPGYQVDWGANTAYTTTSNTNNWEYVGISDQTIKYWDWSAAAYRFFAVTGWTGTASPATVAEYDATKTYKAGETDDTYSVSMLANTADIKETLYFSRLWYSTGNPTDYPDKQFGKPVTLEFVQPYARVRFIYTYVYPREGITLSEQSFLPTDGSQIKRKGIVKVTYPLSGAVTKESYLTTLDETSDSTYICEDFDPEVDTKVYTTCDNGWYTVLPNLTQGSYTLTVSINGLEKTAVVPAEYMQWKPGYSYTYIFKITDKGGIEIGWVDYAVTPWNDIVADHTVYNW